MPRVGDLVTPSGILDALPVDLWTHPPSGVGLTDLNANRFVGSLHRGETALVVEHVPAPVYSYSCLRVVTAGGVTGWSGEAALVTLQCR